MRLTTAAMEVVTEEEVMQPRIASSFLKQHTPRGHHQA
jgi:hypothetical protein